MKHASLKLWLVAGLLFVSSLASQALARQSQTRQASARQAPARNVQIFLTAPGVSSESNPYGLKAVQRRVGSKTPALNALTELLRGPNAAEQAKDISSVQSGKLYVDTLSIRNGTARVNFAGSTGYSGHVAPYIFREAVTKTLLQFPNVKKVMVRVNGDLDFEFI